MAGAGRHPHPDCAGPSNAAGTGLQMAVWRLFAMKAVSTVISPSPHVEFCPSESQRQAPARRANAGGGFGGTEPGGKEPPEGSKGQKWNARGSPTRLPQAVPAPCHGHSQHTCVHVRTHTHTRTRTVTRSLCKGRAEAWGWVASLGGDTSAGRGDHQTQSLLSPTDHHWFFIFNIDFFFVYDKISSHCAAV